MKLTAQTAKITRFFSSKIQSWMIVFILGLSLLLCLQGLSWGRVEEWNADQVGMRCCFTTTYWKSFNPNFFLKPPFHSYVNYFGSLLPATLVAQRWELDQVNLRTLQLLWSRMLTVSMFLASVFLIYDLAKRNFSTKTANITALLYATSAGVLSYTHFLTADIPLVFWMVLTFYVAEKVYPNQKLRYYLLAGFLVGLTTATKYNGVLIAIPLFVFHIFAAKKKNIQTFFCSWKMWLAGLVSLAAFVLGNPFSVLDFKQFYEDIYYLFVSESVFITTDKGGSLLGLPIKIADFIGYPALVFGVIIMVLSFVLVKNKKVFRPVSFAALSIITVFILLFGNYSFILKHYLLPIIPFLFLVFGDALDRVFEHTQPKQKKLILVTVSILVAYNLIASWHMGQMFLQEPRMKSQVWVKENIEPASVIEASTYVPNYNLLFNAPQYITVTMPQITGRILTLDKSVPRNSILAKKSRQHEGSENEAWYDLEAFNLRSPDYIAINSSHYFYGFTDEEYRTNHPNVYEFFNSLLNEELKYEIVFDQTTKSTPWYLYPQEIDFLKNRLTIFKRINTPQTIEKNAFLLTHQEAQTLAELKLCTEIAASMDACIIEVATTMTKTISQFENENSGIVAVATSQMPNHVLKNQILIQNLENNPQLARRHKRLFYSILFYHAALDAQQQNDFSATNIYLQLATQLSPDWSYFPIELANVYLHQNQKELASQVINDCRNSSFAKKECVEYFIGYGISTSLPPLGFKKDYVMSTLNFIKQYD